jgi:glycosyltransferase involved in cell wall biosynthesis
VRSRPGDRISVARIPWTTDDNPYQRAVYGSLSAHGVDLIGTADLSDAWLAARSRHPDVLHIHWSLHRLADDAPQGVDTAAWVCDRLDRVHRAGTTLAWTVHEPGALLDPADHFRSTVERHLLARVDLVLVHDEPTARLVASLAGPMRDRPLPIVTAPLGDYRPFVESIALEPREVSRSRARLGIGPDDRVVLAQGALRADKDLPLLVAAFDLLDRPEVVLVIAGRRIDESTSRFLHSLDRPDVRVLPDRLAPAAVSANYRIAELAVLARRVDWTPSSLLAAVAQDTPVVAADLPTSRAALGARGATWAAPGDPEALADALRRALDDPTEASATLQAARAHVATRSWDRSASVTARAFRSAVTTHQAVNRSQEPVAATP